MFQYRKILEMHSEGFSLHSIASATGYSRQKVSEVAQKAKVRDIAYPLTDEMTDHWLEELLFPEEKAMEGSGYLPMDFEYIHRELGKKGVNLKLFHHKYGAKCRAENAIPANFFASIENSQGNTKLQCELNESLKKLLKTVGQDLY